MNNETQPTPEQLARWRAEFERSYDEHMPIDSFGNYIHFDQDLRFRGYLRAKQENEQFMNLAKFGAYLMTNGYSEHDDEAAFGLREMGKPLYPNIEATIKELLA